MGVESKTIKKTAHDSCPTMNMQSRVLRTEIRNITTSSVKDGWKGADWIDHPNLMCGLPGLSECEGAALFLYLIIFFIKLKICM